ncbi:MAG: hypothetical protein Ct9H300mP1_30340 [Planctomycetaceae bacterium]|nr:MAG: hypothetical protein Ct9H300mP1_30340 [Planctomycetaceae bacterium]
MRRGSAQATEVLGFHDAHTHRCCHTRLTITRAVSGWPGVSATSRVPDGHFRGFRGRQARVTKHAGKTTSDKGARGFSDCHEEAALRHRPLVPSSRHRPFRMTIRDTTADTSGRSRSRLAIKPTVA